jgi:hypothetical protein
MFDRDRDYWRQCFGDVMEPLLSNKDRDCYVYNYVKENTDLDEMQLGKHLYLVSKLLSKR